MREIKYSIDEYFTEYDIRWHGTFNTRTEAEIKIYDLICGGDVHGHLKIKEFYTEYSAEVKKTKDFEISLGSINLNL